MEKMAGDAAIRAFRSVVAIDAVLNLRNVLNRRVVGDLSHGRRINHCLQDGNLGVAFQTPAVENVCPVIEFGAAQNLLIFANAPDARLGNHMALLAGFGQIVDE
jgi:hypothetical protein